MRRQKVQEAPADTRTGALIAAAAFLGFVGLSVLAGKLPLAFFWLYLGSSAAAFLAYAIDKSAARKNTQRTRERTLHILGLVGGWPGALVAQQVLRHKSKKASFRTQFWATVIVNCGLLVGCLTPSGASLLRAISGLL